MLICRLALTVAAITALAIPAGAQQTLELTNGDRLSGRLAAVDAKGWAFELAGGKVTIPPASISAFTAPQPIGIRLADGTIVASTVTPSNGQLQLTLPGGARTIAPSDISAVGDPTNLTALEPRPVGLFSPIGRFWGASAGVGFSDKSGNSRARSLSIDLTVARKSPRDRLTFRGGLARGESQVGGGSFETTVSKYYVSGRADVYFGPRFFAFGVSRQERDRFQDIDLRSTYDAGLGVQIVDTGPTDLRFSASGGARVENFTSGGSSTVAVLTVGTALSQVAGPLTFSWQLDFGPTVRDLSDYRFRSDAGLTADVLKGFGFRVGVLNEFDSTPQPGVRRHDMLVTTSLSYVIGQ